MQFVRVIKPLIGFIKALDTSVHFRFVILSSEDNNITMLFNNAPE